MSQLLHETHGHLDLLLQKLEMIPMRDGDFDVFSQVNDIAPIITKAQELLEDHALFIQPTVSNTNFIFNYKLWNDERKIKILIGSHPEIVNETFNVKGYLKEQEELLQKLYEDDDWKSRVIGIGECGLDYYYSQDTEIKKKQWELFESQIQLALELDVPIVIHCRDAFDDLFAMLDNFPNIHGKFDVHCFTGSKEVAQKVLEYNGYFGIGGIVTFKNGEVLREAVEYIPVEHILLETDLPFLAPIPHRGKVCLPEYIDDVANRVSELKSISKDELWTQCYKNVTTLYSL